MHHISPCVPCSQNCPCPRGAPLAGRDVPVHPGGQADPLSVQTPAWPAASSSGQLVEPASLRAEAPTSCQGFAMIFL